MAPIVKAKDRSTGDKVHMGDAHAAWMSMADDDDHGHYLIMTYNDAKHKVDVHLSGCDNSNMSAHDIVAAEAEALESRGIACWGGYSWKAVVDDYPGQKKHHYRQAGFLNIFPGCQFEKEIRDIKNRVRKIVFDDAHLFLEIHKADTLESPNWWMRIRDASGEEVTHLELGGDHTHFNEDCDWAKTHRSNIEQNDREQDRVDARREELSEHVEAERARKAAIVEGIDAEAERERIVNQDRAKQLALQEQRRRMAEDGGVPSPDHEARHDAIVQDLFHHENLDKLERKQRAVARLEIEDQVEQRRFELVEEWHGKDFDARADRERKAELAKRISDAEKRRRTSDDANTLEEEANKLHRSKEINGVMHEELIDASSQMERALNQRAAKIATDKEHRERIEEQPTAPPGMQAKKASLHKELKGSIKYEEHHHEGDGEAY